VSSVHPYESGLHSMCVGSKNACAFFNVLKLYEGDLFLNPRTQNCECTIGCLLFP